MATSNVGAAGAEAHARVVRRLERMTVVIGALAAIATAVLGQSLRLGAGVAVGTALAWLNCRGLEHAVGAIGQAAMAQSGAAKVRVPPVVRWRAIGRYLLIGLVIFVTVIVFKLPLIAVVCGLFALGAAAMAEGFYQVFLGLQKG